MKHATIVGISTYLCLTTLSSAANTTSVNVTSRTETYEYASDTVNAIVLNPVLFAGSPLPYIKLGVGLIESISSGCGRFDVWGFTMSNDSKDMTFNFETTLSRTAGLGSSFGRNGVTVNGVARSFVPTVTPCGPTDVQTRMGGSTSLYVVHAGTGAYKRRTNFGDFQVCRTIEVINNSNESIELPVHISGSATTGVSLAPDATTYATAKLRMHGSVAGNAFDESIVVTNGLGETQSINVTKTYTIANPQSVQTVNYEVAGEFLVDVSAKGIGFFGLITQSATAGVDFPNTIEIRNFTGENGGPLPPNVVIRVPDESGAVLADTTMRLLVGVVSGTSVNLIVNGAVGHNYQIEHSGDLENWSNVGSQFLLEQQAQVVTVTRPTNSKGFFRLKHQ